MIQRPAGSVPVRCGLFLAIGIAALAGLVACTDTSPSPTPSPPPRPAIQIDQTWGVENGTWTFTGRVDPQADPTDVVLEIGPGPSTLRQFDTRLPVATGLVEAGPLTISTSDVPDVDIICVRFTATNSAGTSSTSPLCVPHDQPSIVPPSAPTVRIDQQFTVADGQWTFTGRIDPGRAPTDVILEIGPGPTNTEQFDRQVPVATGLADEAALAVTTSEVPVGGEVCVLFIATNSVGSSASRALCFEPVSTASPAPSPTPGAS